MSELLWEPISSLKTKAAPWKQRKGGGKEWRDKSQGLQRRKDTRQASHGGKAVGKKRVRGAVDKKEA